jgi:hypothetical protein
MSPGNFIHDVIIDQLVRQPSLYQQATRAQRLDNIFGFPASTASWLNPSTAVVVAMVIVAIVIAAFVVDRRHTTRTDMVTVALCAASVFCLLVGSEYQMYYSYFPIPFLAPTIVLSVHRLWRGLKARQGRESNRRQGSGVIATLVVVLSLVVAFVYVGTDASWQRYTLSYHLRGNNGTIVQPAAMVSLLVPPGVCTIADSPAVLIVANRFISSDANCPAIVDPYGMFLALNNGQLPPNVQPLSPQIVSTWSQALQAAQCVVMTVPFSGYIPWDSTLVSWFRDNFVLVYSGRLTYLYLRRG